MSGYLSDGGLLEVLVRGIVVMFGLPLLVLVLGLVGDLLGRDS